VVAFVDVVFVKIPVEGVVLPIAIPSMVPPKSVTDGDERAPKAPTLALAVEPVAVVNRSVVAKASVAVADVKTAVLALEAPIGVELMVPPSMVKAFTTIESVTELAGSVRTPVTARLVVVVFVPVAFVQVRFVRVNAPVVNEAIVAEFAKRFVVVTVVPVTLVKMAVEALVPPMAMPLIVPPDKVTEGEDKTPKAPVFAFAVVPVAVVNLSVVAKRSVEVALVVVVYVKIAVEGVVAPIVVPLIVPPVTVTDGLVKEFALTVRAVSVVPEAVANPSQTVEVTPEKKAPWANSAVEVVWVLVVLVKIAVEGVAAPMAVLLIVPPSMVKAFTTIASVTESVGKERRLNTAKFVVVTWVPVA
jgi:hypothetical protein